MNDILDEPTRSSPIFAQSSQSLVPKVNYPESQARHGFSLSSLATNQVAIEKKGGTGDDDSRGKENMPHGNQIKSGGFSLSDLAQKHTDKHSKLTDGLAAEKSNVEKKTFSLSALAAQHNTQQKISKTATEGEHKQPSSTSIANKSSISLAALADSHNQMTPLSSEKIKSDPPKLSLADLAARHQIPLHSNDKASEGASTGAATQSNSLSVLASEQKGSKTTRESPAIPTRSLADLAAEHNVKILNTPPKAVAAPQSSSPTISLATLAAQHGGAKGSPTQPSASSPTLADLAARHQEKRSIAVNYGSSPKVSATNGRCPPSSSFASCSTPAFFATIRAMTTSRSRFSEPASP